MAHHHTKAKSKLIEVSNHLPRPARDVLIDARCAALDLNGLARVKCIQDAIEHVKACFPSYFKR